MKPSAHSAIACVVLCTVLAFGLSARAQFPSLSAQQGQAGAEGLADTINEPYEPRVLVGPAAIDPQAIAEFQRESLRLMEEKRAREYQASLARHREKREQWQGTDVQVTATSERDRNLLQSMVPLFSNQPPEPKERLDGFAEFFDPSSKYRCVGWICGLRSVAPVDDGWLIYLSIGPRLMAYDSTRFVVTTQSAWEVWHVSMNGELSVISVKVGPPGVIGRL